MVFLRKSSGGNYELAYSKRVNGKVKQKEIMSLGTFPRFVKDDVIQRCKEKKIRIKKEGLEYIKERIEKAQFTELYSPLYNIDVTSLEKKIQRLSDENKRLENKGLNNMTIEILEKMIKIKKDMRRLEELGSLKIKNKTKV